MKLLLDTHTLLWYLTDDPRLSVHANDTVSDDTNDCWLSPASLLEIALKVRTGKLTLHGPFASIFPNFPRNWSRTTSDCCRWNPGTSSHSRPCHFTIVTRSTA